MIKIVVLTNGISIGGVDFPNNSLVFEIENKDFVQIFLATNHHKIFSAHYSQYINSTDQLYASSQAVITDLLLNNKASSGGGGGSGDFKADGSVPMTGQLQLVGDPTGPLNPVTKQLFDSTTATINSDITNIKNNESKVLYYEAINSATGTITKPANTIIFLSDFPQGYDAVVETIVNGEPTGQIAKTAGGTAITVSSFDTSGNYTLSGTPSSYPVALLYILRVKALYMSNLTFDNIIEAQNFSVGNASDVVFTPNGDIAATDVQSAIVEVRDDTDTKLALKLAKASNLSDLANAGTSRTNLGLGGAATLNVGTTAGTVAAGDDSRFLNAATPVTFHDDGGYNRTPASNQTYYLKTHITQAAVTTSSQGNGVRFRCPRNLTFVSAQINAMFTNGSNQAVTFTVNNVTTGASAIITSTANYSSNFSTNHTLSFACSTDDYIEVRMICPTFTTAPTSLNQIVTLYYQ